VDVRPPQKKGSESCSSKRPIRGHNTPSAYKHYIVSMHGNVLTCMFSTVSECKLLVRDDLEHARYVQRLFYPNKKNPYPGAIVLNVPSAPEVLGREVVVGFVSKRRSPHLFLSAADESVDQSGASLVWLTDATPKNEGAKRYITALHEVLEARKETIANHIRVVTEIFDDANYGTPDGFHYQCKLLGRWLENRAEGTKSNPVKSFANMTKHSSTKLPMLPGDVYLVSRAYLYDDLVGAMLVKKEAKGRTSVESYRVMRVFTDYPYAKAGVMSHMWKSMSHQIFVVADCQVGESVTITLGGAMSEACTQGAGVQWSHLLLGAAHTKKLSSHECMALMESGVPIVRRAEGGGDGAGGEGGEDGGGEGGGGKRGGEGEGGRGDGGDGGGGVNEHGGRATSPTLPALLLPVELDLPSHTKHVTAAEMIASGDARLQCARARAGDACIHPPPWPVTEDAVTKTHGTWRDFLDSDAYAFEHEDGVVRRARDGSLWTLQSEQIVPEQPLMLPSAYPGVLFAMSPANRDTLDTLLRVPKCNTFLRNLVYCSDADSLTAALNVVNASHDDPTDPGVPLPRQLLAHIERLFPAPADSRPKTSYGKLLALMGPSTSVAT
jgi:hypothetical protein